MNAKTDPGGEGKLKLRKPGSSFKFLISLVLPLAFSVASLAQKLPAEIRGYKVYQANIKVGNAAGCDAPDQNLDAFVSVGDPKLGSISLGGLTINVPVSVCSVEQTGRVDFLTFQDFRVNGLAVEIQEFTSSFQFGKKTAVKLPRPANIFIDGKNVVKAAYKELVESKNDWAVTGTVFVFGKFKKMGFSFKRVVPIKIDLKIKNPL